MEYSIVEALYSDQLQSWRDFQLLFLLLRRKSCNLSRLLKEGIRVCLSVKTVPTCLIVSFVARHILTSRDNYWQRTILQLALATRTFGTLTLSLGNGSLDVVECSALFLIQTLFLTILCTEAFLFPDWLTAVECFLIHMPTW